MLDYDYCDECRGYGNDYKLDENDEWVSACEDCLLREDYEDD